MSRVLADAVLHPLFHDSHDGSIHLVPTKFEHTYQNLRRTLNEKLIESSTSIRSVAQTLTKKKEKDNWMDRGRGEKQRELQKELNREKEKWKWVKCEE